MMQAPNCYTDFLKCLSLYVQDVLTANELITLLEDLMGGMLTFMSAVVRLLA